MIYEIDGHRPQISQNNTFVANSADIIGQVSLSEYCSVWFNAVIRGDNDKIYIGARSNIQDGVIVHTDTGFAVELGCGVTVGHGARLHGCRVGDFSMIGINAVVLNGAVIGGHSLVGANTLIPEGKIIPSGVLVLGNPGKIMRQLTDPEKKRLELSAEVYTQKINRYRQLLRPL